MNRAAPSLALAAGLALVATVLGLPSASAGPPPCQIGQVLVSGTAARHVYKFQRLCSAINGFSDLEISAVYDVASGRADEKLRFIQADRRDRRRASWTCDGDPWIYDGPKPQCTLQKAESQGEFEETGSNGLQFEFEIGDFPLSAEDFYLTAASRHVLAAQLRNALAMAPEPGAPIVYDKVLKIPQEGQGSALEILKANLLPADLTVAGMQGPGSLQAGLSGTYTVTIQNTGNVAAPLELHIIFGGKLDQTGQIVSGAGLACDVGHDAGINAAVRCTGGQIAAGGTATVVVQGRGQAAGAGMLIATLNNGRSAQESNYDNNFKQLDVTIN